MSTLRIDVVRANGAALAGTRESVVFELTLQQPLHRASTSSPMPLQNSNAMQSNVRMVTDMQTVRTDARKRSYLWTRASSSDVTLEFDSSFQITVNDRESALLIITCFKGNSVLGLQRIAVSSLPKQRSVQKWFQLQDNQRRNVNALVFLRLQILNEFQQSPTTMIDETNAITNAMSGNYEQQESPTQIYTNFDSVEPLRKQVFKAHRSNHFSIDMERAPPMENTLQQHSKKNSMRISSQSVLEHTPSSDANTLRCKLRSNTPLMPNNTHTHINDDMFLNNSTSKKTSETAMLADLFFIVGFDNANLSLLQRDFHTHTHRVAVNERKKNSMFLNRMDSEEHINMLDTPHDLHNLDSPLSQLDTSAASNFFSHTSPQYLHTQPSPATPRVLMRFPAQANSSEELESMAALMCFPNGSQCSSTKLSPVCFNFFLSSANSYGAALVYWSSSNDDDAKNTTKKKIMCNNDSAEKIYVPTAIVVITRAPFGAVLCSMLSYIYTHTMCSNKPHAKRMLARYLATICLRIPAPCRGCTGIQLRNVLGVTACLRERAHRYAVTPLSFSLIYLLRVLDVDTVLSALSALLTGRKMLVYSSQLSLLLPVCECLLSLMSPLRWTGIYIPLLPRDALTVLDSPVTFFVGALSSMLAHTTLRNDTVTLDVDMSRCRSSASLPLLPRVVTDIVNARLRRLCAPHVHEADTNSTLLSLPSSRIEQHSFTITSSNISIEHALRNVFIHYVGALLRDYRQYVSFDQANTPMFDDASFLEHRADARPFLSRLIQTQSFIQFISQHSTDPSLFADFMAYSLAHDDDDDDDGVDDDGNKDDDDGDDDDDDGVDDDDDDGDKDDDDGDDDDGVDDDDGDKDDDDGDKVDDDGDKVDDDGEDDDRDDDDGARGVHYSRKALVFEGDGDELNASTCHEDDEDILGECVGFSGIARGVLRPYEELQKPLPQQPSKLSQSTSSFDCKHALELHKIPSSNSRVARCATRLIRSCAVDSGEVCSVLHLVRADKVWRVALHRALHVIVRDATLVNEASFDALVCIVLEALEGSYEQNDFASARALLWFSTLCYSIVCSNDTRVYIRDMIHHASIWHLQRFWSYMLSVDLLQGASSSSSSSSSSLGDVPITPPTRLIRTSSLPTHEFDLLLEPVLVFPTNSKPGWSDFVFSTICAHLCTVQALGITQDAATSLSMNLAHTQNLDEQQCSDLITLISNIYRASYQTHPVNTVTLSSSMPSSSSHLVNALTTHERSVNEKMFPCSKITAQNTSNAHTSSSYRYTEISAKNHVLLSAKHRASIRARTQSL